MSGGRIHALLIATRSGHVVFERFYDNFSEPEKGEIRACFDQVGPRSAPDDLEHVGRYKNGRVVMLPSGELLFFALGTGEYNELALVEVLRGLVSAYKDILKAPALTDVALFQNYALTCLVVDEVCREGLVEHTDKTSIQKAIAMRIPMPEPAAPEKGRTFRKLASSKQ